MYKRQEEHGATHFNGYDDLTSAQAVLSVVQNDKSVKTASDGEIVFITNQTPFTPNLVGKPGIRVLRHLKMAHGLKFLTSRNARAIYTPILAYYRDKSAWET